MRTLWTLAKIMIGLALLVPLGIIVAAVAFGVLGMLIGLAVLVLKIAVCVAVVIGLFKLVQHLLAPAPRPERPVVRDLPVADRHYEAAMRELDTELGHTPLK